MVYKDREDLQEKAISLRKQGYGYRIIGRKIGVPFDTTIRRWVEHIEVDKVKARQKSVNEINDAKVPTSKTGIRNWLLRNRGNQCQSCKRKKWLGKPIAIEVEHIDGNNKNNDDTNLLLLCPNCHSQTETWRRKKSSFEEKTIVYSYCSCGNIKRKRSKVCKDCRMKQMKKDIAVVVEQEYTAS